MIELNLGISLLLLLFVWKFIFKPAILDYTRDKLYDGREDLRNYFANKNDLNNPAYHYGRNLYNHNINYIKNASMSEIYFLECELFDNEKLCDYILKIVKNKYLKNASAADLIEVEYHLDNADVWVKAYLVLSSPLLLPILCFVIILSALTKFLISFKFFEWNDLLNTLKVFSHEKIKNNLAIENCKV